MGLPRYVAAAMVVWLTMPALAVAQSATPAPVMAKLQTMVDNLGHNLTLASDAKSISFTMTGDYNDDVTIDLSEDQAKACIIFQSCG